jgi:iron(III) transport system substrate-binding protein
MVARAVSPINEFAHRSFHAEVKPRPGQTPMSSLKLLKSDPAAVQAASEELKARYGKVFRV